MQDTMAWFLEHMRRLYSLNTLDTRFTISSTTPPNEAVSGQRLDTGKPEPANGAPSGSVGLDGRPRGRVDGARPLRWRSVEFYVYYLVFLVAIPLMFKTVYDVSKGKNSSDELLPSPCV